MNIPHFDLGELDPNKRHLLVTDINLCVHFHAQGICDERDDLSVPYIPRARNRIPTQPANHFSLWLGFGLHEAVMLDVVQDCAFNKLYFDKYVEKPPIPAVVRFSSKTIPTDEDMATVLRELNVRPGTTVQDLIDLIITSGRHRYMFMPVHMQQVGCRHWIHTLVQDLEERGIVGTGCAEDMHTCLKTYYRRHTYRKASRRWTTGGNWGPVEMNWIGLPPGTFYEELGLASESGLLDSSHSGQSGDSYSFQLYPIDY